MILVKKIIALLAAIMLLLSACSSATLDGAGKELEDTIANATDADNKYVQMVKGGYRPDDPDTTYEDAFTAFFGTPRWKYFESEDGQDVVEFTGDCTYQDVPVKARIQFVVDEENGTFEASYLAFNEVPQDALTLAALLAKAFEGAEAVGTGEGQGRPSNTTEQILIRQIPTQDVLKMTADEVIAAFGEPEIYAENDSIEYGADSPEWMYFDVSNGNTVASFSANVEEFTLNGQSLKQNFDALVSLMGDNYDSLGAGGYQWIREGICYTFYIPDDTEPYSINVYRIDNDNPIDNDAYLGSEGNYGTYGNLDSALVGRWRSFDGGTLQFDDNGMISSCDFNCWSLVGENPNRVYWETSNGRVSCSAYFDNSDTYTITSPSSEPETEYISFSRNRRHMYQRTTGENGDGIIGTWTSVENSIWSFQFNEDGTGMYNGRYPITWSTYTADDGADAVRYSLIDSTYFDYTVEGDSLVVFLSDSSRVYTKVGN